MKYSFNLFGQVLNIKLSIFMGSDFASNIYIQNEIRPVVKTELQWIMVCHLIGPFFARLEKERTRVLTEVVLEVYNIIHQISMLAPIVHTDTIADLLYHIKYKHVGEMVRNEAKRIIVLLPDSLRNKLRFLHQSRTN